MASQTAESTPNYTALDYAKFFGAGALAATLTHGVGRFSQSGGAGS
jgi:hypothetical protein